MNQHRAAISAPTDVPVPAYSRRWAAMVVLLVASFMNVLDVGIVNVALPNLRAGLNANSRQLEWVVAAYILTYALALLPFGRLGDVWGRKTIFIIGVAAFSIASLMCGAAPDIGTLIACRALQGLAAGMMSPQVMAIAMTLFAPKERGPVFAFFGLIAETAAIAGPLLGGALVNADFLGLGWRMVFFVNIVIGVAAVVAAAAWVPKVEPHPGTKLDWAGALIAAAAILGLVFPVIEGRGFGWPVWCYGVLVVSAALLLAFMGWELRQDRRGAPQVFPAHLMRNHDYIFGSLSVAVFFSALQGFFLVFVIFLQQGFRLTPFESGLATAAFPAGVLVTTWTARRMCDLKRRLLTGAGLLVLSCVLLWIVVARTPDTVSSVAFVIPLLVGGLGGGLTMPALFQAVMRTVPLKDAGAGSGALQVFQQLGGALGVAVISEIFFARLDPLARGAIPVAMYRTAFEHTLVYFILAYLMIATSSLWMKFDPPSAAVRQGAGPAG